LLMFFSFLADTTQSALVVGQGDKMSLTWQVFQFKFGNHNEKERICSELMSPPCKLFRVYLSVCVCVFVVIVCLCVCLNSYFMYVANVCLLCVCVCVCMAQLKDTIL